MPVPADRTTLHLIIHGKVQGVFFRDSMRREAHHLGITGWVRNLSDGTVEAMIQGEATNLDKMVLWAHHGPEQAKVERAVISAGDGKFNGFEILK